MIEAVGSISNPNAPNKQLEREQIASSQAAKSRIKT